jgi:aspartate/tyrosine/aromatic aminotransferase
METLKDPQCFKGNHMQEIKGMIEFLEKKVKTKVDEEITKAKESVAALQDRLCGMDEFKGLTPEQETRVLEIFSRFCAAIEREGLIAVVRDRLRRFEESDYQRLLAQL